MVKSIFVKSGLVTVMVLAALSLTTCQTLSSVFREPRLSLHSVDISKITFTGTDLLCKVKVQNPNPITIPFPEVGWELFVNTNSFVNGVVKNNRNIAARGSTIIDVPVSMKYLEVFNTFRSLKDSNQANYRIALAAKFSLPVLGNKVFNLSHTGTLPLLHLPTITFKGITVKSPNFSNPSSLLNLTKIDFGLVWEVENNNSFAMSLKDLSYNLTVNNSQLANSKLTNSLQIAAGRKTEIPLTVSVNSLSVVKTLADIIIKGTDVSYLCGGNINLGAALPGLADFGTPFNFSGTTRLRN